MTHFANIILAYGDCPEAHSLHGILVKESYSGPLLHSGKAALEETRRSHPDVVLVGPSVQEMSGLDLVRAIKSDPETATVPVCLIAAERTPDLERDALDAFADDVIVLPGEEDSLFARIHPLVRLATMHWELQRRAIVGRNVFGIDAAESVTERPSDEGIKVLCLSTEKADIAQLTAVLGADSDIVETTNPYEAESLMSGQNFDAAVMFVNDDAAAITLDLCTQIRNNPRLFNLPVVLVAGEDNMGDENPYRNGVSRVIYRPAEDMHLRSAVISMVRRQRLRWAIRQGIDQTVRPLIQDKLTGVYTKHFMISYLEDRLHMARQQSKHLSVVAFHIPNIAGVGEQHGLEAENHLTQQLAQWITGLVRVEDPVALIARNLFFVVLPDTPIDEAQIVMHRIAGVLSYTDFAVFDVYEVVKVWPQAGAAEVKPDDTVDSIIERARAALT